MVQEITIEKLYDKLCTKLEKMKGLTDMYIGKAENVEERKKEHKERNEYNYTIEIAYGDAEVINDGEKFLIAKFKKSKLPCRNVGDGGEGNNDATKLYISYNYDKSKMKTINNLEDDELDIISYKLKN